MKNLNYKLMLLDAYQFQILLFNPNNGRYNIVVEDTDGAPDGVVFNPNDNLYYWSSMGKIEEAIDGSIKYTSLDGKQQGIIINVGDAHTPKQITLDPKANYLYWCDKNGMKITRCNIKTKKIEVLLDASNLFLSEHKESRFCVGIAIDIPNNRIFWTMKGKSNGDDGRILMAPFDFTNPNAVINPDKINIIFDKLPEPIFILFDDKNNYLYWSDRGDSQDGNSLNCADLSIPGAKKVLIRGFHEAMDFIIDDINNIAFISDLSGHLYQLDLITLEKNIVFKEEHRGLTGIAQVIS